MKKIMFIFVITVLISFNGYTDEHCNKERKEWIRQLKIDLEQDLEDVVYSNDECFVKIIAHKGISMEDHLYRIAGEKRDSFKDPQERKTWELLNELFVDLDIPKHINWVPDNNKDNR
jgi:hypothetical protein